MRESYWRREHAATRHPRLERDLETDVVIVGAGITGLTTGWLLQRRGVKCCIVDSHEVGAGTSGSTSAHVTEVVDEGYHNLIAEYGQDAAHMVAAAYRTALASITAFGSAFNAHVRPVDGYRFTESERDVDELKQEAEAARKLGIRCELTSNVPLPRALCGVRFPNQVRFHPVRYLHSMADELSDEGGQIFEGTEALKWEESADGVVLYTNTAQVRARHLILATHTPLRFNLLHTELGPYRSYLVAMPLQQEFKDGLYWDNADPYHYLRLIEHEGERLLLVGGEDHKTGQESDPDSCYARLEEYTRERYSVGETKFRWSDEFFEPADGLPYVGFSPASNNRVLVGTGYSGVGLTGGTVAALILADLVTERENPWADVFSPRRVKPLVAAKRFISENADVAWRWVADRFSKDAGSLDEISPGEGAVVKLHGRQVAAYRTPEGQLLTHSPVCTHMGCIVGWNQSEKTWDCPCHGGRFHPDGSVLSGPPVQPLDRLELDEVGRTGEKPAQNVEQRF